jgi:hypothetical protein
MPMLLWMSSSARHLEARTVSLGIAQDLSFDRLGRWSPRSRVARATLYGPRLLARQWPGSSTRPTLRLQGVGDEYRDRNDLDVSLLPRAAGRCWLGSTLGSARGVNGAAGDPRFAKSKRLVGRCRSVPLTCASCRPASLSPGLRRPAWLYQWLYSQAVSGHTQLPWKINVFFSTWGILVPASSCGWEPCSHPMPQTSPSGRGGTPRLR